MLLDSGLRNIKNKILNLLYNKMIVHSHLFIKSNINNDYNVTIKSLSKEICIFM